MCGLEVRIDVTYTRCVLMLAYATSIQPFLGDAILDRDFASHYPGAAVWPAVGEVAHARGWDFATADVVLERVRRGEVSASDVRVIQEEDAPLGNALVRQGAMASLLLCGESPLFAREFYRRVGEISRGFETALLFRGALGDVAPPTRGVVLHFPGFHRGSHSDIQPWEGRAEIVMIAGNKYWQHEALPLTQRLRHTWRTMKDRSHFEWLRSKQLHDRRLEYVTELFQAGLLTLYGPGWDSFRHLPARWRDLLVRAGVQGQEVDYARKQVTVGGFRFALVMENFEYPGYVTEKIIDALAAGTIPLYLGAPDIDDFIPSDVFLDLRNFTSPQALISHLAAMDAESGMAMIQRGQDFLTSAGGDIFSFEHQAEHIVGLATA